MNGRLEEWIQFVYAARPSDGPLALTEDEIIDMWDSLPGEIQRCYPLSAVLRQAHDGELIIVGQRIAVWPSPSA